VYVSKEIERSNSKHWLCKVKASWAHAHRRTVAPQDPDRRLMHTAAPHSDPHARQRWCLSAVLRFGMSSRHPPRPQVPISVSDRPTPHDCIAFQTAASARRQRPSRFTHPAAATSGKPTRRCKGRRASSHPNPPPDLAAPVVLQHPHSFISSDLSGEAGGLLTTCCRLLVNVLCELW
jgi:hypothetical protein